LISRERYSIFWYCSYYCKMIWMIQIAMEKLAPYTRFSITLLWRNHKRCFFCVSLGFWSQLGNIILSVVLIPWVWLCCRRLWITHQSNSTPFPPHLQSLIVFDRSPVYVLLSCVSCCFVVHIIFAFPSSSTLYIHNPYSPTTLHNQIR
jgi:hypothetical protein